MCNFQALSKSQKLSTLKPTFNYTRKKASQKLSSLQYLSNSKAYCLFQKVLFN